MFGQVGSLFGDLSITVCLHTRFPFDRYLSKTVAFNGTRPVCFKTLQLEHLLFKTIFYLPSLLRQPYGMFELCRTLKKEVTYG